MIGVDRSRHPARGRTLERCRSTEGPTQAIQLPPLRSPKDGPPQRSPWTREGHVPVTLQHAPLRRRVPFVDHAQGRLSTQACPQMSCG